jgi:excisionase family DNA binding protein
MKQKPGEPLRHKPEPININPLLVPVEAAARAVGVGRTNMFRLIGEGHIRAVKLGSRTLIPVAELEAFAARLMEGAAVGCMLRQPEPQALGKNDLSSPEGR